MAIDDVWQVTNEFTYQGNPNNYSFYLQIKVEGDASLVPQDMLDFGVSRETAWLALHNPFVLFKCVTARQIFPTASVPELVVTGNAGNRTCTPVGDVCPGQCSAVVTQFGDKADPTARNRGRDFITGFCSDDQINGVLNSGPGSYLQELCDYYAAMTNRYNKVANEYDIGTFSRSNASPPGVPPPPPIVPFFWPLQFVRAKSLIRTQRRRQPSDPCEVVCDQIIAAVPPP